MDKKKVSIIGGGFSGCASALLLKKFGYDITLLEKGDKLGGTTSDILINKESYFNGPHYFNPNSLWAKEMMRYKELKKEFYFFENYKINKIKGFNFHGSYTDIFGNVETSNLFAHPITSRKFKEIYKFNGNNTLSERIDSYQKNISSSLKKWLKKYSINYEKLHHNCADLLNIGRVCFNKNLDTIIKLKENNSHADSVLGVPSEKSKLNRKFFISKRGNNYLYKKLYSVLNKQIKIIFNSKVKIKSNGKGKIEISNDGKTINSDYIVWAANPVYPLKELGYGMLDNPVVKVKIYFADIEILNSSNLENFYIQVFSLKSNIFRIYFYKINEKYKISVETFLDKKNDNLNEKHLREILLTFNFKFKLKSKFLYKKEVRHYLMTCKDFNTFKKFDYDFKNSNLVSGGWHLLGRERKLII